MPLENINVFDSLKTYEILRSRQTLAPRENLKSVDMSTCLVDL